MTITAGTKLGRYEIRSPLGAGGMGEVYLAQDTSELERTVALKILPAELASNQQRMQRFIQEAKTVSALNHPNILTIHEIGQAEATRFIVTEYIDGVTLRQHLKSKRVKLHEVLDIAIQVAAALDAAHEAKVVHRDIKPENIMVRRRDAIVKVLDFGLAKLSEPRPGSPAGVVDAGGSIKAETNEDAKTKVLVHTEPGVVMGTVSYMSPEQSVGSGVDHRTDIWSAGVLLYEMLAGVVPFEGKDIHRQIIAIQEQEPAPLSHYVEGVPARLEEIVVKCLAKDKDERYQTAKDLLIDLRNLRRRLDVDAEIERTVAPEKFGVPPSGGWLGGAPTSPPEGGTPNTHASSAEYIVSGIKQHKTSAVIAVGVLVLAIAAIGYYLHARNTEVAIESIAVLPFVNQNRDADSEYLSDGVTESIINSLTQLPNLKVSARSSVFRYKGKETDPLAAGKELGVRAVLTGRILQRGDNLSISTELIDVRDNKQLWGEQYSAKVSDLLSVQRQIASQITSNLRLKLSGAEQARVTKHYTENPEAYQAYLKGRYYWNKRTEAGLKKGIEYFQQAVDLDPTYALAYTGLADSYSLLPDYSATPTREVAPKAKAAAARAAARAIELDPNLAEAHTSLAEIMERDWDFAGAEKEFQRAIELNPNYATSHHWYANLLDYLGRNEEAKREILRAQELEPLSLIISNTVGAIVFDARQYDQAIEQFKKTLEIDPNFPSAHEYLALAYERKGRYEEAITELNKAIALAGRRTMYVAELGHIHSVSGNKSQANKMLEELTVRAKTEHVSAYYIAIAYAGLGDKEKVFAWLEKAFQERDPNIVSLKADLYWDSLRSDPRFSDLMRRVGLPQ